MGNCKAKLDSTINQCKSIISRDEFFEEVVESVKEKRQTVKKSNLIFWNMHDIP